MNKEMKRGTEESCQDSVLNQIIHLQKEKGETLDKKKKEMNNRRKRKKNKQALKTKMEKVTDE